MEIERKFWIKKPIQFSMEFNYHKMSEVHQHYINKPEDFYEIRLREYIDEDRYYLEFKGKGGLIREEFGTKITKEQFENILYGAS